MVPLESKCPLKVTVTSSYQMSLLENLKAVKLSSNDNVVSLISGDDRIDVSTVLLMRASKLMRSVIGEPCTCQSNHSVILPPSPPTTLDNLRTLLYTGHVASLSEYHARHVVILAKQMDIDITMELKITENNERDKSDSAYSDRDYHNSVLGDESVELQSTLLITKTSVSDRKSGNLINLCFPKSRIERKASKNRIIEKLSGFEGRVQQEYNKHSVGQYMGPYDQNEKLNLSIQLPNTKLNFESYTEFQHSGDKCYNFCVKSYEKYDDHNKIDAYQIKARLEDHEESSNDQSYDSKFYTCQRGNCKIPCTCPQCCSDQVQCTIHKMKHIALFDENKHAISIRSSSTFCLEKSFFNHSYILRYSGIPTDCKKCAQDVFFHHSYHLEFHEKCRFCRLTFYKLRATTEKEHHSLEKKEAKYYKTVCPYCDRRFREAFDARKHIESTHEQKGVYFKCDQCDKEFLSLKSKQYHETVKHSTFQLSISCDLCDTTFKSEVNLKSHKKYVHSDIRNWPCSDCEAKFKQKRDLRAHMLRIHNINLRKEDYLEHQEEKLLKCEHCILTFRYKKNLKAHVRKNHSDDIKLFECEDCLSKFKERKSLISHQRVKHGPDKQEHACSVCGKIFLEKKNMKKHEKKHQKT